MMLLEDAEDLCDFLQATKRTVPANRWATEVIAAAQVTRNWKACSEMPEAPNLIIPVRMDATKAVAGLAKVGVSGKQAGDAVAGGAAKAKKGLDTAGGGAEKLGSSLAGLMKAQIGLRRDQGNGRGDRQRV